LVRHPSVPKAEEHFRRGDRIRVRARRSGNVSATGAVEMLQRLLMVMVCARTNALSKQKRTAAM
jgi:hypothetical protein